MPRKKDRRNTRGKIISAAWKLFYEQGYADTTIEDIVFESGTSKGSFYHYFPGKEALMGTLAYVFDEKYEELTAVMDPAKGTAETLVWLNHELFAMIERSVSRELLTHLLSSQLLSRGEKHLLDRDRTYFRLLRRIVREGRERGEVHGDPEEIVRAYAMWERALMYDWCLYGGEGSLTAWSDRLTPRFLEGLLTAGED